MTSCRVAVPLELPLHAISRLLLPQVTEHVTFGSPPPSTRTVSVTWPSPVCSADVTSTVGTVLGVTAFELAPVPWPEELRAATVNTYRLPLVSPVIRVLVVLPETFLEPPDHVIR